MMPNIVTTRPFTPGDDETLIARGLRERDEAEARKVAGVSGAEALRLSVRHSHQVGVFVIHGEVAGIYGVGGIDGTGIPWLVAHDDFERPEAALSLARACRRIVAGWLKQYDNLVNLADPEHEKAVRFLGFLGFTFDWGTPFYGPLGHLLVRFRHHT